jgi:hypothetical protein
MEGPPPSSRAPVAPVGGPDETGLAAVEAVHATYRGEIAKLKMQLVLYRQALLDHHIEPPNAEGEELLEMVRRCNAVISTTSEVVRLLGSSKEMTLGW